MPNRILRDGILTSKRIARLSWAEEVFYRRLMSVVDDFGRYYADYGLLRSGCYPRQLDKVSDSDVGKWLQATEKAALVRVYPAQDGERYLELMDFKQQVRATKSKFPQPPSTCIADATQLQSFAHLDVDVDVDVISADADGLFTAFWAAYPRKVAKPQALKAWKRLKLVNGDFEKVMVALERAIRCDQWQDPKFIPHPATWLNQRRFEDEENLPPAIKVDG